MKILFILLFAVFFINASVIAQKSNLSQPENTFTDTRDGEVYQTVTFNNDLGMGVRRSQTWLAENLRYEIKDNSWWYENDKKKNRKYGRLYTWEAAKKACPRGWHLPTDIEWQILMHQLAKGGRVLNSEILYKTLLEGGDSGFAALLGGGRYSNGEFYYLSEDGFYWSATERGADIAWYYYFSSDLGIVNRFNYNKADELSCRCLKD